ncbi:MAG TPA: hypothetical protein VFI34_11290 [Candidatus Limnocylindrales bacterium]|nr:hypothetical protein [Candidatus Limnocylindrales bacterium]
MRGCLFVLIAAAVIVVAAAWFGAPPLASAVVGAALGSSGFEATTLETSVTADPPPRILLGHADAVRIRASGVAFRTFQAETLDLTLTDVDLIGRTAGRISGTIDGAAVNTPDGIPTTADVTVDGDASGATSEIRIAGATVDRVVRATLAKQVGVDITRTELAEPDVLRIVTAGATIEGRIVVDSSGAIALSTRLGETRILGLDPSFPMRLTGVHVIGRDLRIDATLDAEALLGG